MWKLHSRMEFYRALSTSQTKKPWLIPFNVSQPHARLKIVCGFTFIFANWNLSQWEHLKVHDTVTAPATSTETRVQGCMFMATSPKPTPSWSCDEMAISTQKSLSPQQDFETQLRADNSNVCFLFRQHWVRFLIPKGNPAMLCVQTCSDLKPNDPNISLFSISLFSKQQESDQTRQKHFESNPLKSEKWLKFLF